MWCDAGWAERQGARGTKVKEGSSDFIDKSPEIAQRHYDRRLMCDWVCASAPACVMAPHSHDSAETWATSQVGQVAVTMWMI